ncbi:Presequence protease 2, chloroplastic/mitochondrial [Folsomia candida]|uniref:Presequence protease 2, chloroplastic/mitochondrial n=1 Tax=Folsomia candida TaxID=158441 RepID=A0A226DZZ7_FOLCA|nr:Presequence protease 2, chloroplastic/mitochondrial [Folsomia candida]
MLFSIVTNSSKNRFLTLATSGHNFRHIFTKKHHTHFTTTSFPLLLNTRSVASLKTRTASRIMGAATTATGATMKINLADDFQVIMQGKANNVHPVTKYRSTSTGLEVVHADIEGPIVNGYIVLATRATDDDGLPHTLEHLIFMGSEDYPYKGVLDILANKCFASGTNAWTDVDHTAYTLTTAGSEGFCNMLGIYMDHIFHPILSDSAFVTEVYHTTGDGTDAGVVYCELQAKENTAEERVYHELVRTIYPPTSGYHYQTGGICKNIRETCNNDKVKKFHTQFYNPRNTCVIVCGRVTPEQLFKALEPTIAKLNEKGVIPSWTKPWLDDVPEINAAVEKHVNFPAEDDDEEALVTIGFRGPSAITEIETVAALRLLFEYLTDSSVGPMQLAFVENDDPICSQVTYAEMENSRTTFYLEFEGVGKDKMPEIISKTKSTLEKQVNFFDMSRMTDIIKKNYQEELSSMENTPHNSVAYAVIGDFLYGSDNKEMFEKRINCASTITGFLAKDKAYWISLIKEKVLGQKWVTVYAHPSKETFTMLAKEEEGRVAERRLRLGAPGLTKMGYELDEAIKTNSTPAPASVLEQVSVPCADSIHFHTITRYANPDWADQLKCNFYMDDIKSNFVYVSVHMDTSSLSYEQLKYLPLFREVLVESPVLLDNGTVMSFEDVMELSKLDAGFSWLRLLLFKTQFSAERTKVVATKMAADIPQMKRKGNRMAYTLLKDILYQDKSPVKTSSLLRQHKFLKGIGSLSAKKLGEMFNSIRAVLTSPANVTLHIAANLDKMKSQAGNGGLNALLANTFTFQEVEMGDKRLSNAPDLTWMKSPSIFTTEAELRILGNRAEESSYMVKVAPGVDNYSDPELPILLTAMQYLCQTEGPFYRGIRGAGLAYDFFMDARCNEGLIYFNLYRCTDVVGAFKAAKEIVMAHCTPPGGGDEDIWDMISKILAIKLADLQPIVEKYLKPVFLQDHVCSIVSPQDKVVSIVEGFETVHAKKLQVVTGLANSFLEKWADTADLTN